MKDFFKLATTKSSLAAIAAADRSLERRYRPKLIVNPDLGRSLVSFQANRHASGYRWCKYREGFSADLVRYLFQQLNISARGGNDRILDPFAGSGTSLFCANEKGIPSTGIELLPSSCQIIQARDTAINCDTKKVVRALRRFARNAKWQSPGHRVSFPHLRITAGAFPKKAERLLERFLYEASRIRTPGAQLLLNFSAMCVLEAISYTRKDGQYLRWDGRSGREGNFHKGRIADFSEAVQAKIDEIVCDMQRKEERGQTGSNIELLNGSCLERLPELRANQFTAIVTSPPYCNRYDYTRTYALELAMLGIDEDSIRNLRQTMLTCTVENREKAELAELFSPRELAAAEKAFQSQRALRSIRSYLDDCKASGVLNNAGIPRMVSNYFREMSLVIHECARVLKPGAPFVMVNDNVRYQGVNIPVDLILSDFATAAGLHVEKIWVLPVGKGNSSQQMGKHGRTEMRKCVYVWRKPRRVKRSAAT